MQIELNPVGNMCLLSPLEVDLLQHSANSELYQLYRNCSLAVLNVGSTTDDAEAIYETYKDFDIQVLKRERGVKLRLINPPSHAFVDGKIIKGIQEQLSAVLRDILFISSRYLSQPKPRPQSLITHIVFDIIRNADAIKLEADPSLITCWGGHSINHVEYKYCKEVGYELGLRHINICTGCGPGAMKGPMKGATFGHAKQRNDSGRYVGLTEPSIIAAEPPNTIVNELVIMPDIEKRLEAFVRLSHGLIIFPGGAGTAEELLYVLGILLHPENKLQKLPIVLTGPKEAAQYFADLDKFIGEVLGAEAQNLYSIIIDDPEQVAQYLKDQVNSVISYRKAVGDSYHYNWTLEIEAQFQQPFEPSHDNMADLRINKDMPVNELAANLRRVFSGIVAGNVKPQWVRNIRQHGPYEISGDKEIMTHMDNLLSSFVKQQRMKLQGEYTPCYKIVSQ
ncbi:MULTISPECIES: nucleotide 5'-monophosphate nucleosidase PpnN [unclassified Thalassotalea]|uniref:nucleotide 5'-monophosphate nucleosidase PpnN n=1 Tax=unclassified Thalassotalea TaxID=2614972 RepID=UPI001081A435|nr:MULTISPECIES: nucleotide 5'-monophosphate nucleosidase PpnN [unclassified Thalassotalea]NMP16429.1 LOG family protein [Thalassotalea sp. Y01]QBY03202.1 LOG family protein [Thalassotalea sp. HSM 43]